MARKPRIITEVENFLLGLQENPDVPAGVADAATALGTRLRDQYHAGSANKTKPKKAAKKANAKR